MANNLTQNQMLFVQEYLQHGNATQAYKVAYPSCKSAGAARASSAKLLAKANVRAYIAEINEQTTNSNILNITQIKELYSAIAMDEEAATFDRIKAANSLEKLISLSLYEAKRIDLENKKIKLEQDRIKKLEKQQQNVAENGVKVVLSGPLDKWGG